MSKIKEPIFWSPIWRPQGQLLGHIWGVTLTLCSSFPSMPSVLVRPEGHWDPRNKVGSLSPAERKVVFEPSTFKNLIWNCNLIYQLWFSCEKTSSKTSTFLCVISTIFTNTHLTHEAPIPQNGQIHLSRQIIWVCLIILWGWRLKS